MATRAVRGPARRAPDWRAALKRSVNRTGELLGAAALALLGVFLALSMASYTQTDASFSTAAGGTSANWMGAPGAYAADGLFLAFGPVSVLLLPMLWVFARRLWQLAEHEEVERPHWWRPLALLALAMVLLASVLALLVEGEVWGLPAGMGGIAGLLGSKLIYAVSSVAPDAWAGWVILALAVLALIGGAFAVGRVFAIDWASLLTLPLGLKRDREDDRGIVVEPKRAKKQPKREAMVDDEPEIVDTRERRAPEIADPALPPKPVAKAKKPKQPSLFDSTFSLPSPELLAEVPDQSGHKLDKLALERNARLLENVLEDFNVKGEITAVRTGPVVTMYELEPAPGIKAARVMGLADDIARNMSAISARVSAIPGKTVMGIELPNADRQMVSFRELIESEAFGDHKGMLPIILGKDIAGEPIVADLAAMPHLLVAGTTGSGKSVGLNAILLSLLYRLTPAECRLILIDPKVLELKTYDDIPHLLSPVVTEPHKSVRALKWAVEEMERRYRMMSSISSRNLAGFNEKVRAAAAKGKPLGRRVQTGFDPETGEEIFEEEQLDYEPLPQIVLIVDELADLMITVGKEIEVLIQRLSQKSRAAGIHLIMATQRPSVDVITGVIKANMPTRISFHVTSRIDSRTILGEQGAEQLLGKGDMLYKASSKPLTRVHGPFVSDEEVEEVAEFWRGQGSPEYVDSVTEEPEDGGFAFDDIDNASDDPEQRKYVQVCQMVFENQKASASWIQRQMGVGYNTASKWIERMEKDGLVGPANHVGRREIYRDRDGNVL
ncbi:FtsK/SpoIIIE family DNA translocase [Croceicoccus naphthovorans]|uniref:DNA translocase FtsK n=1 Tax=Croceicoccus naphthovorans TaxID=1348774 RepID=A0A0G3XKY6_9SPHN|nr:DNA translocase FtsK [Croceicoccus naphthovorans]AKM11266.1 cell division protein FtsK [Croceicoccus naphthovorans]MBB3989824.1 S-DNA-T family DNA segregation ATPase FtsK/SpoIIIE [Croceicoccus naphthovorans]